MPKNKNTDGENPESIWEQWATEAEAADVFSGMPEEEPEPDNEPLRLHQLFSDAASGLFGIEVGAFGEEELIPTSVIASAIDAMGLGNEEGMEPQNFNILGKQLLAFLMFLAHMRHEKEQREAMEAVERFLTVVDPNYTETLHSLIELCFNESVPVTNEARNKIRQRLYGIKEDDDPAVIRVRCSQMGVPYWGTFEPRTVTAKMVEVITVVVSSVHEAYMAHHVLPIVEAACDRLVQALTRGEQAVDDEELYDLLKGLSHFQSHLEEIDDPSLASAGKSWGDNAKQDIFAANIKAQG